MAARSGPAGDGQSAVLRASPDYVAFIEYFMVQERPTSAGSRLVRTGNVMNSPYVQVIDKRTPVASGRILLIERASAHRSADREQSPSPMDRPNERIVAVGPDGYYVLGRKRSPPGLTRRPRRIDA